MEWTKIPTSLITKRYTDYELVSIIKFQLLWAELEEQPDKKTALRYMTERQYDTAMTYLDSIASGVCDALSSVKRKREVEKIRYNKNKNLQKILPTEHKQNSGSLPNQIRLDNIKEIYKESFDRFWEEYPKQRAGSKQKAYQAYCKAIKEKRATEEQIFKSVQNYKTCDEVKRGFAKGCAAWLNDDRFNNEYVPEKEQREMTEEELLAWGRG